MPLNIAVQMLLVAFFQSNFSRVVGIEDRSVTRK